MRMLWFFFMIIIAVIRGTPQEPDLIIKGRHVTFYLHNQGNVTRNSIVVQARKLGKFQGIFNTSKETLILVHGWRNDHKSPFNTVLKKTILEKYDVNLLFFEWEHSHLNYFKAVDQVVRRGKYLGTFIRRLSEINNYPLAKFRLVGYSLGAHICGIAGKITRGQIKSIIGLEPAGWQFTNIAERNKLARGDAKYVEVIHTCSNDIFGISEPIGDSDFYVNQCPNQPGCNKLDITCCHYRAYFYYEESLKTGGFIGTKCGSYENYIKGYCRFNEMREMGMYVPDDRARGIYFLKTAAEPPYALGKAHIETSTGLSHK